MRKTMDQLRAAAAMQQSQNPTEAYTTLVKGTAAQIMTAGLGQTVAFYKAKGKAEHVQILSHLAAWLLRTGDQPDTSKTPGNLMTRITTSDSDTYRADTAEALAYLGWLKRFAEAQAPQKKGREDRPAGGAPA